jgi:hypothetical protein
MQSKRALLDLVQRTFESKKVSAADRLELVSVYGPGGLTTGDVASVYRAFLRATWGDVIDDELLTREERMILVTLVRVLRLPPSCAPFPAELEDLKLAS